MKVYKTQQEVEADIKDGVLAIRGDVTFECNLKIEARIIVSAWDISAGDITAQDISYYAFCCVYDSIKCTSIKGRRDQHQLPICLDGDLTLIPKTGSDIDNAIKLLTEKGLLKDGNILVK